ncbi:MAG: CocE/NonD family hydrolase [Actinomycetota bacterium]
MRTLLRRTLPMFVLAGLLVATGSQSATAAKKAPPPRNYIKAKNLSKATFPQTVRETYALEALDGEELYIEVVRPDPAAYGEVPRPVILEASPYHGTLADRDGTRIFPDPEDADGNKIGLTGYFAPRGYAVAMFDLRGTGRSTGCLDHLGQKDATDLEQVIEWLAAQPWSNGRVGMTGHSYVGSTPSVAAAQVPDGLVTIVPSAGLASMYDHQFQTGVPYLLQWVGPMYAYEALAMQRDFPPGAPAPPLSSGPTGDNFENAPNPQFGCGWQNSSLTAGSGQVTGQYQLWHAQRDWSEGAAEAEIPVFMIHGVNDNAARIPAAEWFFTERFMRSGDKVWLGQWDHGSTNGRCGNEQGRRTLHPTCRFDQFQYALHAWFDKHLMRRNVETGPPVEVFLNGETPVNVTEVMHPTEQGGLVYTAKGWPKPQVIASLFPDAADSSLAFEAPAEDGSDSFGTTADAVLAHVGQGRLTFRSEPVTGNTLFLGVPQLQLNASVTTGEIIHLTATLFRERVTGLDEEGNEIIEREPMNVCAIQPQLRFGVQQVAPVIPGEEMDLPMQCFTMAHWIPAGQRLALEISTGTPHHATFGSDQNITVYTGPDTTEYRLPVVPNATLYPDVPLHEHPYVPPPVTRPDAQPGFEESVIVPAPGAGEQVEPVTAASVEFDVLPDYDNANFDALATPTPPADIDLFLQEQNADGTWSESITAGTSGDLDKEVLSAGRLDPGHYRVIVHNWGGGPTLVDLVGTFKNSAGEAGGGGGAATGSAWAAMNPAGAFFMQP